MAAAFRAAERAARAADARRAAGGRGRGRRRARAPVRRDGRGGGARASRGASPSTCASRTTTSRWTSSSACSACSDAYALATEGDDLTGEGRHEEAGERYRRARRRWRPATTSCCSGPGVAEFGHGDREAGLSGPPRRRAAAGVARAARPPLARRRARRAGPPRRAGQVGRRHRGRLVEAEGTRLHVVTRGAGPLALFVLHGGPGLDHTVFADHLDTSATRSRCTSSTSAPRAGDPAPTAAWTLGQLAADVDALATTLGHERYAVPRPLLRRLRGPAACRGLRRTPGGDDRQRRRPRRAVPRARRAQPRGLRTGRAARAGRLVLGARGGARTQGTAARCWPTSCRSTLPTRATDGSTTSAPGWTRWCSRRTCSGPPPGKATWRSRSRPPRHGHPPVLVLAGRHDRVCSVPAAEAIAAGVPGAELRVFEDSGHMMFAEEQPQPTSRPCATSWRVARSRLHGRRLPAPTALGAAMRPDRRSAPAQMARWDWSALRCSRPPCCCRRARRRSRPSSATTSPWPPTPVVMPR